MCIYSIVDIHIIIHMDMCVCMCLCLFLVPAAVITVLLSGAWFTRFDRGDFSFHGDLFPWVALGYACMFATVYAYNGYSWAGKRVSPAITTVYNTLQPVGTSTLSVIFLGTVITLPEIVGGVLVMIGLVITVYGRHLEGVEEQHEGSDEGGGTEEYLLIHEEFEEEQSQVF
jgi:drug/metabolite transporter (DMT)-like permease